VTSGEPSARVLSVNSSRVHSFSKEPVPAVTLVAGHGVQGDAHYGVTVKHRSRVKKDPFQPNLRQVHLIHSELFEELAQRGFHLEPGFLGENVTTEGVDLLALPRDTLLHLGKEVVVRITGLRNPCSQLDDFRRGLMAAVLDRTPDGKIIRKSGVMGVVVSGGTVNAGDAIRVELPARPHTALEPV
jgi:MOSC domain-containing protein YiiM